MKNSQHTKQFCLLPLRVQIPIAYNKIQSITECKKDLVIALDGMRIYPCQIEAVNNSEYNVTCGTGKKATIEHHEIYKMIGIDDQLLLLYRKNPDDPGVLFAMTQTEKLPIQVCKGVVNFAANVEFSGTDSTSSPTIAVIVDTSIIILRLSVTESLEGVTRKWVELHKVQIRTQCLSVAIALPSILVQCPSQNVTVNLSQKINENDYMILSNSANNSENPYNYPNSPNVFFVYTNKQASLMNTSKNFALVNTPVKFQTPQIEHAKADNLYASISHNNVTVYNFESTRQKRIVSSLSFPECNHICSYQSKYFIVSNEKQIFLVTECTEAYHNIIEGNLDQAVASIKNLNTDILAAIFEQLWQAEFKQHALSMLKIKELHPALIDIVNLFKMIKTDGLKSDTKYLNFASQTDDQKLAKILTDSLIAIRGTNPSEYTRKIVDTALFEIYAYQEDIPKLSAFIDEVPLLSNESIRAFFNEVESPTYAMYLAFIGNNTEAMEVFKKLQNMDQVILDEITQQMIRNSSDWKFCKANTTWLIQISPLHACRVLTSESVKSGKALKFCKKHFEKFYPTVLHGILDHKDVMNRSDLVNNYAKCICQLLLGLNDENFNRDSVAFCKCVIANPNASIQEIEEELGNDFIDVLRRFPKDTDANNLLFLVNQIPSTRVQVEIYRAAGNVEKALSLIWGDKNEDPDIAVLEQFCRESSDPSAAFMVLIKLMKEKLPADKEMSVLMNLLAQNMSVIDVSSALANINENQKLEDVASFLESSYRKLVTMRKDAELDAAFASSNEFESEYQRIRLESQSIQLTTQTICPKCKQPIGYQYVLRAPNGTLYHWKCLQANQT
ncbi:hypothetical protein TRFO_08505 [Tritrichomonas foetus]|uniref:Vacuolar sorting protein 39/Transforming growth factor beta receptor-associated zinc finger domain-containing protein n=1 Tax=Tritrichomonas foetus TaxID=1144522 RepID=A0A1J4JJC7_9EUKA|nr:hypothetical protein TRFO_08505 [Tritrichomonas foetus]|eukprot:OHS99256.1 hypothetical protein TRFO_08505 [Tritrichomonas foetus]